MQGHHPDCDGFTMHYAHVRQVSREGRGMWQATCPVEACNWVSPLMGPDGKSSQAMKHSYWEPCDGHCLEWD